MKNVSHNLQKFAGLFGIVLMIFFAGAVLFWESVGRDLYLYEKVVVVKEPVKKGASIKKENLKIINIEGDKLISNAIQDINSIKGVAAKNYIPANSQLCSDFFVSEDLALKDDEYVFKVPIDWVEAIPSSLRRLDKVSFVEVKPYKDQPTQEASSNPNTTANGDTYKTYESNSIDVADSQNIILKSTVAYVKDNANREVVDVGDGDRYNGSSQVSAVEIIVKDKDVEQLKESVKKGFKFLVLYQED